MNSSPKKGDLIVFQNLPGLIVKETKKYLYYFYDGYLLRSSKENFEKAVDLGRVELPSDSSLRGEGVIQ
jgi:hypothetical protein